jgi:O-antigen/teichoic acid export membrane protein
MRRPILRALLLVGATEGARGLVMVVTNAHLARSLGERSYGVIGFAQTVYLYAALLGNFGLEWIGARHASQHTDIEQAKVSSILGIRLVTCASALLLMLGFCALTGRSHETKLAILAFTLTVVTLPVLVDWYFYGKQDLRAFISGRMIGQATLLLSVLVLVRPTSSIVLYPLLFGVSTVAQTLYFLVVFLRRHGKLRPRFAITDARTLVRSSGTFFLSLVCTQVVLNFSFIALGLDRAERALGQYTAGQRLAFGVFASFGTLLGQAFFPVLSRQFASSAATTARTMRIFWLLAFAAALAVAAIGAGLNAPLMQWIYSPAYRSGGSTFAVLMAAAALLLLECPLVYAMLATHHERFVLARGAIAAGLCVVLNVVMVPAYGAMGAALANLIAVAAGVVTSAIGYAVLIRSRLHAARAADRGRDGPA